MGAETERSSSDSDSSVHIRQLPPRRTRGQRAILQGSDAELDNEFWNNDTWREGDDEEDEEWVDEGLEGSDEFDSDFFESESEEDAGGASNEPSRIHDKRPRRFDYEKITRMRKKRLANSTRQWSVLDAEIVVAKGKKINQETLMAEAQKVEKENLKVLQAHERLSAKQEPVVKATSKFVPAQIFFSWSSERRIAAEDAKKTPQQLAEELRMPVRERQLCLLLPQAIMKSCVLRPAQTHEQNAQTHGQNGHPTTGPCVPQTGRWALPAMASLSPASGGAQNPVSPPRHRHKYLDPLTKQGFSTVHDFRCIRQK